MLREVTILAIGLTLCAAVKSDNSTSSAMSLLYKTIATCAEGNTLSCLRKRTVILLDKASHLDDLQLWGDAVALIRSPTDIANTTEDSSRDRSIGESFNYFLDSHRLQLRLPRLSYFVPSEVTGRGKKNKGYGVLAMTIIGAMMAMGMAGLAAMAGKALAASMAALMMAALAALRKGGGGGGGHGGHSSYEVISIPTPHHHRSFYEEQKMNNNPYRYDSEVQDHEKRRSGLNYQQ